MKPVPRLTPKSLVPKSMSAQMIAVLSASLVALLAILSVLEILDQSDLAAWAGHESTISRLRHMKPALDAMPVALRGPFLDRTSSCHRGYSVTATPHVVQGSTPEALRIRSELAQQLGLEGVDLLVGRTILNRSDFSYARCGPSEIEFPVEGLVISTRLASGDWLNAEIHPHEWHLHEDLLNWMLRSAGVFLFVGAVAVFFTRRLSRPLANLTGAAERFGSGLEVSEIEESGPPDLRRAIAAFNTMQKRVAGEVSRRASTLAAISHDIRSPLTALRIKAELVQDAVSREDLVVSIDKMERITASALDFLKDDTRHEPMRDFDLAALLRHECSALADAGCRATYAGPDTCVYCGRPDGLARAVRNLIENAHKYADGATITLHADDDRVCIDVSDQGPGVPEDRMASIQEPFERLSSARESNQGGFGLGLAIVKAICEGHEGELALSSNQPTGLKASMRLPARGASCAKSTSS